MRVAKTWVLTVVGFAIGAMVSWGCYDTPDTEGLPCGFRGDCNSPEVCLEGFCNTITCAEDGEFCSLQGDCCNFYDDAARCIGDEFFADCRPRCQTDADCDNCCLAAADGTLVCHPFDVCGFAAVTDPAPAEITLAE